MMTSSFCICDVTHISDDVITPTHALYEVPTHFVGLTQLPHTFSSQLLLIIMSSVEMTFVLTNARFWNIAWRHIVTSYYDVIMSEFQEKRVLLLFDFLVSLVKFYHVVYDLWAVQWRSLNSALLICSVTSWYEAIQIMTFLFCKKFIRNLVRLKVIIKRPCDKCQSHSYMPSCESVFKNKNYLLTYYYLTTNKFQ